MPFNGSQNQLSRGKDVTILAATALTATGQSAPVDVGGVGVLRAKVVVSAVSGTTPSITPKIQTSHDAGATDPWRDASAAYTALTAAGSSPYQSFVVDRYIRVAYTISGTTPSLTVSVAGEAV